MTSVFFRGLAVAVAVMAAGGAWAGGSADDKGYAGYLQPGTFNILPVLPVAPAKGDARYEADRRIFRESRQLAGGERYKMATDDANQGLPDMLRHFSCAVGIALTPALAPKTVNVIQRAATDTKAQVDLAKDFYRHPRPFRIDQGQICQNPDKVRSWDYPSGHASRGWTWAFVLTDLLPGRSTRILARGRAFAESRAICGVHNMSAVEGGAITAAATFAVVRTTPAYQADAAQARAELQALRADPGMPRPTGCEAEEALEKQEGFEARPGH